MFEFGKWLKSARKESHVTQVQLSDNVGISTIIISNYETGRKDPSYLTMMSIIDSMGYEIKIEKKGA